MPIYWCESLSFINWYRLLPPVLLIQAFGSVTLCQLYWHVLGRHLSSVPAHPSIWVCLTVSTILLCARTPFFSCPKPRSCLWGACPVIWVCLTVFTILLCARTPSFFCPKPQSCLWRACPGTPTATPPETRRRPFRSDPHQFSRSRFFSSGSGSYGLI